MAKEYYRLRHHVYIINMVRKHIWFNLFRAQTKKRHFGGADPAGIGQAGSQTGQVLQMQDLIAPLRSSRRTDRNTYMVRPIWSPNEITMNFGRFSPVHVQQNRPGQFWNQLGRFVCSRTSQAGFKTGQAGLPAPVAAQSS